MKKVILASGSPRRLELLKSLIKDFKVVPSDYEEDMTMNLVPSELVMTLAKGKADDVAKHEKGVVIGADTIIVFNGKVLGKPKSKEEAKNTLKELSGNVHKVYTGVVIIDTEKGKEVVGYDVTEVEFKEISDKEIEEYVETGEPMDKAGSYAIQGLGKKFVKEYNGSYTNIIGLPMERVEKLLVNLR